MGASVGSGTSVPVEGVLTEISPKTPKGDRYLRPPGGGFYGDFAENAKRGQVPPSPWRQKGTGTSVPVVGKKKRWIQKGYKFEVYCVQNLRYR